MIRLALLALTVAGAVVLWRRRGSARAAALWLAWSPRRVGTAALTAAAVLAFAVTYGLTSTIVSVTGPRAAAAAQASASPAPTGTASGVAATWTGLWLADTERSDWAAALGPYSTNQLSQYALSVDPASIPPATITGSSVLVQTPDAATVRIGLSDRTRMDLDLVRGSGGRWRVTTFRADAPASATAEPGA